MNYLKTKKPKRRLSIKFDHLLDSCKSINSNSPNREEMSKNFKVFQQDLENLKTQKKTITIEKTSKNIQEYINSKYNNTESSFKNSIESTQLNDSPILSSQNKRKPRVKTIIIEKNKFSKRQDFPKDLPDKSNNRKQCLDALIKDFMKKRFGVCQNFKEKSEKVNRLNSAMTKNPGDSILYLNKKSFSNYFIEENEKEYLAPEFKTWEKDTKNKLKVEKIISEHHQKERRQQMAGGINELKLIRYETMAIKYIND